MMRPIFYQSPAGYRAESMQISRHWWITLPILIAAGLCMLSLFDRPTYRRYLQPEGGILETLHVLFAFASAAIAVRILFIREIRTDPLIVVWLAFFAVGGVFLGGEEASWGQHFFGWSTPQSWAEVNWQNETNLHNASIWFDHVPRGIITAAIVLGGLVIPWMKLAGSRLLWPRVDFVYPPLALVTLAALFVLAIIEDVVDELTGLSFDFAHSTGEMQENFIISFVFFYMLFLWRRAVDIRSGAHVPELAPASGDPTASGESAASGVPAGSASGPR